MAILAMFAAAGGMSLACVDVEYPDKAFRCDPSGPEPTCPDGFFCCSDDPMTLEFDGDDESPRKALPAFDDRKTGNSDGFDWARPFFAGERNNRSHSGMCVKLNTDAITLKAGAAAGCPVPCNPRWERDAVEAVCGAKGAVCCQTTELRPLDCIRDEDNCSRPVVGDDIFDFKDRTTWSGKSHRTHQDPGGLECAEDYESPSIKWETCVRRLSVADQRGFCVAPTGDDQRVQCPLAKNDYLDVCEAENVGNEECS